MKHSTVVLSLSALCSVSLAAWLLLPVQAMPMEDQLMFRQGMISGCLKRSKENPPPASANISDQQISNYCTCSAEETLKQVGGWGPERFKSQDGQMPSAFMDVLKNSAKSCSHHINVAPEKIK
jgi:hypothetical protein